MKVFGHLTIQCFLTLGITYLLISCKEHATTSVSKNHTNYAALVNPFIGTDGPGNTYPGATVPFGMVQLSPDIGVGGWDRIAGYYYQDTIISSFSHTHLSGTGAGDLYDIPIMPVNNRFSKRIKANGFRPFSRFSHKKETAMAGYYSVKLLDYGIKAELTATPRTGIHRYTFPKNEQSQIHLDLGYAINWDKTTDTHIKIVNKNTVVGYRKSTGWAKDQRIYFVLKSSKAFESYTLFQGNKKVSISTFGKNSRLILDYNTQKIETIVLKVAISSVSIEGALQNLKTEAPDFDFEKYRYRASALWNKELQKIKIETPKKDTKQLFYTMLYQSMLAPTIFSDVNGAYKGAHGKTSFAKNFERYDTFSLWDTYRAAHPLYTLLHTKRTVDIIQSLLAHAEESGRLPVWSLQGNETDMMIGYHAVPVIVDAYFKGIPFDYQKAFQICKKSAMFRNSEMDIYREKGYIPMDTHHENWSVSKTLEYAYDDWCIAQFAKGLGIQKDYQYFSKRAQNWKNIYDKESKFMRPKRIDGSFLKDFNPKDYSRYFCESNAWQYFWSVQQDIEGVIDTLGGKSAFESKLDSLFTIPVLPNEKLPIFSTGMIGQYVHGNEPSHHIGYLYNYVDKPWKTQKIVHQLLTSQYHNRPDGHCGNEDCGQMSSWYVWSSLGLYPVNPAQGVYAIGTPLFTKASIQLKNNKTFVIEAKNVKEGPYIQKMWLNDNPLERYYITHQELLQGGRLVFKMGTTPLQIPSAPMAISSKVYR